jgi:hypothetical protein
LLAFSLLVFDASEALTAPVKQFILIPFKKTGTVLLLIYKYNVVLLHFKMLKISSFWKNGNFNLVLGFRKTTEGTNKTSHVMSEGKKKTLSSK